MRSGDEERADIHEYFERKRWEKGIQVNAFSSSPSRFCDNEHKNESSVKGKVQGLKQCPGAPSSPKIKIVSSSLLGQIHAWVTFPSR